MMQGVVQRGTGVAVKAVGKPIAGKTGTTSDWQDAWFVGFTPDLAAGVFVGYDDPVSLGSGEQAAVVAAPIFRDFMIAALKDEPATEFRTPPGLRMYRVSPTTGLPASGGEPAIWEAYSPVPSPARIATAACRRCPARRSRAMPPPAMRPPATPARATPPRVCRSGKHRRAAPAGFIEFGCSREE